MAKIRCNIIDPTFCVGKRVFKRSGKPFKSGRKGNRVKAITANPQHNNETAFSFDEDDSIVDISQCWVPATRKWTLKGEICMALLLSAGALCGSSAILAIAGQIFWAMSTFVTGIIFFILYQIVGISWRVPPWEVADE